MASIGAHKSDFWNLTDKNIYGQIIKYRRGKNNILCVAPFRDNEIFKVKEYANLTGGYLFKRISNINYFLKYLYLHHLDSLVHLISFLIH